MDDNGIFGDRYLAQLLPCEELAGLIESEYDGAIRMSLHNRLKA